MNDLNAAVEGFLAGQKGEVSITTAVWYGRMLSAFLDFAGPVRLDDISPAILRAYRAYLIDRDLSLHSVHGHQRAVRRLFAWLLEEGCITRNVALKVPLVRLPPESPKALTDEDMGRLLARLPYENVRDRAIILLLIDTGCRVGGLCSMTVDGVDLDNHSAMVTEKGDRGRSVYFTELAAQTLALYLSVRPVSQSSVLFLGTLGRPMTVSGIGQILRRVGERAGVKGRVNAHSFRHAFARSFLRNGGNLATLAQLLGHSPGSPVTAKYYARFDDRELKEFHERYSPLAQLRSD